MIFRGVWALKLFSFTGMCLINSILTRVITFANRTLSISLLTFRINLVSVNAVNLKLIRLTSSPSKLRRRWDVFLEKKSLIAAFHKIHLYSLKLRHLQEGRMFLISASISRKRTAEFRFFILIGKKKVKLEVS